MSIEAIKHIMATVLSAQNALRSLAPEYKWAGMGNLLGDYGEFICVEAYGLTKAPPGSNGYDALTPDGRKVQIKTNHASGTIGFRGQADLMLVIYVGNDGEFSEIYYGDFAVVQANANYSKRDNKSVITVSKLRQLAAQNEAAKVASSEALT